MEIIRLMVKLLLIILLIAIGKSVLYKDNYVTITGSITVSGSSSENKDIDYPNGFNEENCVPVAFGIKLIEKNGFNYYGNHVNSTSGLMNAYTRYMNLLSDKIRINVTNSNDSEKTFTYKIVLMKVE